MRKHFQIVIGEPFADHTDRPGLVRRLKSFFEGLLATAFILGTLIAAIVIGTTLALALWIAVAIILVALIIRAAFRRRVGRFSSGPTHTHDGKFNGRRPEL
jgi:membrane protein implicated in regulation of membrane protease activity